MENKKHQVAIGVDLGGTSIKYALVGIDGKIYKENQRPTDANAENHVIIGDIKDAIMEMKSFANNAGCQISAIGIGSPGCVDVERGFLMGSTPNFRYWRDVPIADTISNLVDLPVFVDNDANLMVLGEVKYGAGIGANHVIGITVGTGIGGGIIINGKLYRGSAFAGAELGHMSIISDGLSCKCGGKGCLEQYASASAIIREYCKNCEQRNIQYDQKNLNVKSIFELYKKGDPIAEKAIKYGTYYLGRGLANFINIFNPELIVLGGGVAEAGNIFIDMVNDVTFQYAMEKAKENVKIVSAKLGNKAGYLGAISFAFESMDKKI